MFPVIYPGLQHGWIVLSSTKKLADHPWDLSPDLPHWKQNSLPIDQRDGKSGFPRFPPIKETRQLSAQSVLIVLFPMNFRGIRKTIRNWLDGEFRNFTRNNLSI